MADGLGEGMFQAFLNYLYSSKGIEIPGDFHGQCSAVQQMLSNDTSGIINSLLDYSVNSSSEANYRIECSSLVLQKLLNLWLNEINIEIAGIPTGLQPLAREYFLERWRGSSLCVLRLKDWQKITIDNTTIEVPQTLWFVNGGSVYIERAKDKNYKLGSDKFFLDEARKIAIPSGKDEEIIITKPFDRWHVQYPTPYLVRKGILKNWLGLQVLQEKSDEVLSKILPYLFTIKKGTENLFLQGEVNYTDEELTELTENFKIQVQKYRNEKNKVPTNAIPFDTEYSHLIPDLGKILKEDLYRQFYRAILAGLGMVDLLEISPSRQETRINPKAFVSEINEGVAGFKQILLELVYLIEERNKNAHKKLFSDKGKITVVNSPLRINVEQILDSVRSCYDRGGLSIESYVGSIGFDYTTEKERRQKELDSGDEDLMYPHLTQNVEAQPDRLFPAKPKTNKQEKLEDENKKKNTPETKTKTAELEDELIIAPYDKSNPPAFLKKYPKGAQEVFIDVFNKSLPKGEDYAFPVAWSAMKRWLKKHGYKKIGDKWVKSENES